MKRKVSATELAGMVKCERQAELKVILGEEHSEEALERMRRGTEEHKKFEQEDLEEEDGVGKLLKAVFGFVKGGKK